MLYPGFSCASNSPNIMNDAELCNSPCHGYTQPSWRSPKLCLFQQLTFGIALTAQSSVPARLSLQIQALLPQPWQRQMLLHWHLQAWLSSRPRSHWAQAATARMSHCRGGTKHTHWVFIWLMALLGAWDTPQDQKDVVLGRKAPHREYYLRNI